MISILRCDPGPMQQPRPEAEDPLADEVAPANWLTRCLLILGVVVLIILGKLATTAAVRYFESNGRHATTAKSSPQPKHVPRMHPPRS